MAGRVPLFTDACVNGHLVEALIQRGWNLVRAIDLYPERTPESFEELAREEDPFAYPIRRLKPKQ